tara:strand:+ start:258 stop:545 length:288 start_codon:yes stop_codon:yes gene_type:complete
MSLIFKPKIPVSFRTEEIKPKEEDNKKSRGPQVYWSSYELDKLIALRVMGVSYLNCSKLLHRGQSACVSAIDYNDLYGKIDSKRKEQITKIMRAL